MDTCTTSFLFYGLYVKTADLCFAADAYEATQGPFLAIDMICARRSNGVLKIANTNGGQGAARMPLELWLWVKEVLTKTEREAAELAAVKLVKEGPHREVDPSCHLSMRFQDVVSSCPACSSALFDLGGTIGMLEQRKKVINDMLKRFRLCLPDKVILDSEIYDATSIYANIPSAVALTLETTDNNYPFDYVSPTPVNSDTAGFLSHMRLYQRRSAIVESPQDFTLPRDAVDRFESACSFLRLEVANPASELAHLPDTFKTSEACEALHTSDRSKEFSSKPHWRLWAACHLGGSSL
ncbi:hypothetical protein JCM5296_005766 [Sporobolomyces johnsonii]